MRSTSHDNNGPVNLAKLAREIAMDVLPLDQIMRLHELSDIEWGRIQSDPRFQAMLVSMTSEWNSADNTKARVRTKSATAFEALIEVYVKDAIDPEIPLAQRVEVGKLLCKIGELEAQKEGRSEGGQVLIQINTGAPEPIKIIADTTPAITPPVAE